MHAMYKVEIEFGTEAPLYARRNYYVRSHEDVMALRAGAEGGMYRVGSATLEHIMSPAEVLTDIVVERVETSKAMGLNPRNVGHAVLSDGTTRYGEPG